MDTLFSFKSKTSARTVNNNAMMRLKIQNALYQQELNKVKAANAALALAAEQQKHEARVALAAQQHRHHDNEAKVALAAQQQREHEAKVALAAHQREHEARVALAAQSHKQEAKIALAAQPHKQEVMAATHNKKAPFGKLISNMNKRQ